MLLPEEIQKRQQKTDILTNKYRKRIGKFVKQMMDQPVVINDHVIRNEAFLNDRGLDPFLPNIQSRQSLANLSNLDRSQLDPAMSLGGPQTITHSPSKVSQDFGLAYSPSRSILSKQMSHSPSRVSGIYSPRDGKKGGRFQPPMKFGANKNNDEERILVSLLENIY